MTQKRSKIETTRTNKRIKQITKINIITELRLIKFLNLTSRNSKYLKTSSINPSTSSFATGCLSGL